MSWLDRTTVFRRYSGPKELSLRLALKHLNLTLQSSAIIISRAFQVVVHLLDVGHEVRKVRTLDREGLVLLHQANLDALYATL